MLGVFPVTINAQTATPHPNALGAGLYQFEDLSSPQLELTGVGWSICNLTSSGDAQRSLCNNSASQSLEFFISDVDYILMDTLFNSTGADAADLTIQVDGSTYWSGVLRSIATSGMFVFPINPDDNNARITITTNTADAARFNYMSLHQPYVDLSSITGTGGGSPTISTPTPIPYAIYGTISGVSGTIPTRFDYYVTAGDVGISTSLLFLLFSIWSLIIVFFMVYRVRK